MKKLIKLGAFALLGLSLTWTGCKKDNATEPEVITTVVLHLKATDGSLDQAFEWNDPDGDGGNAPTVDNILLATGKTYTCKIQVLDRSQTPEVDITDEIEAENTEHLFVFKTDGVNITIAGADTDANGKPFRLSTTWTAGALSLGAVTVTLKHEPDKNAVDPDATGETDFEVDFPVRIL